MSLRTQRIVGAGIAFIAILALVVAAIVQPIAEWGTWGIVVGFIALLFVMIGLLAVVSKNPNVLTGRRSTGGSTTWNKVAVGFVGAALVFMVIAGFIGGWTAIAILQLGIFGALECLMVGTLIERVGHERQGMDHGRAHGCTRRGIRAHGRLAGVGPAEHRLRDH